MDTVGDMVRTHLQTHPVSHKRLRGRMDVYDILKDLGIWDAEVLECVGEVDEYNREVLSFLEGQPFARLHIDPYGATRKPVRVIVLKGEG